MADSLLMWMLTILKYKHAGSGALRNLPVTTMPSTTHVAHLCKRGTCTGVHEKSRARVFLLRSTVQRCWGGGAM